MSAHVTQLAPLLIVYSYDVIAEPPFEAGAVKATVRAEAALVTEEIVGAPGVVAGTTAVDEGERGLVPAAFVADTVNV
jgi:hypothetical protein